MGRTALRPHFVALRLERCAVLTIPELLLPVSLCVVVFVLTTPSHAASHFIHYINSDFLPGSVTSFGIAPLVLRINYRNSLMYKEMIIFIYS